MRYTRDGAAIPSHVRTRPRNGIDGHYQAFRLTKGHIVRAIYPEERENATGRQVEYVVSINGREVSGVPDMRTRGAIYNYSERVRKGFDKSFEGNKSTSTLPENLDAEIVYLLFLNGDEDYPIIVGSADNPRHPEYKQASRADGEFDVDEFLGVEVKIDKDSNYTITQLGRKDVNGNVVNTGAVGAIFKMHGDGKIEIINNEGKRFFLGEDKQILGQGDEPILLGDTTITNWDAYLTSAIAGIVPGSPGQNASSLLAIKSAMSTLQGLLSSFKSPNSFTD